MKSSYVADIKAQTLKHTARGPTVIFRDPSGRLQVALMSVPPKETVAREVHPNLTQFIRVEQGAGEIDIGDSTHPLSAGWAAVVPSGTFHEIRNTGSQALKLYTLYAKNVKDGWEH